MKNSLTRRLLVLLVAFVTLATVASVQAQAEKIKQKAKDLKKQVEGTATNPPPAKPSPPK